MVEDLLIVAGISVVILGCGTFGLSYGMSGLGKYLDKRRIEKHMKTHGYQNKFNVNEQGGISFSKELLEEYDCNFDSYKWRDILTFP